MRCFFTCLAVITISGLSYSQSIIKEVGARPGGLGNAAAALTDEWSTFNNPGGLGYLETHSIIAGFKNHYSIPGFNTVSAAFNGHFALGTASISLLRFGDDLYNEQAISISYGNKLGIAGLGVRVNYYQVQAEEFATTGITTIDFGGIATISDRIKIGAYFRNISQANLRGGQGHTPSIIYLGLAYMPIDKLTTLLEVEKDIRLSPNFKAGLEYQFLEKFAGRTGMSTKTREHFFGMSVKIIRLRVDITTSWHRTLGFSHRAGILYALP